MVILGYMPLPNALIPSVCFIYFIVCHMFLYYTYLVSKLQDLFSPSDYFSRLIYLFLITSSAYFLPKASASCSISCNFHILRSLLQLGCISYVCKRVFTTSNGLVSTPAIPPAIPAHMKYHKCGFFCSQGRSKVFKFSFTQTTILENGKFIKTVIG
jgi:hypothetical protein